MLRANVLSSQAECGRRVGRAGFEEEVRVLQQSSEQVLASLRGEIERCAELVRVECPPMQ